MVIKLPDGRVKEAGVWERDSGGTVILVDVGVIEVWPSGYDGFELLETDTAELEALVASGFASFPGIQELLEVAK